jgi:uncharacterized protein (TIGR03083 family)
MVPSTPDFLRAIADNSASLSRLGRASLETVVGDCPGWRGRDLIAHVGRVFAAVTAVVSTRATAPVDPGPDGHAPDGDAIIGWFDERRSVLLDVLGVGDPDLPVWTWGPEQRAGFYHRRLAHETAVHVCDLQRALGLDADINRPLAVDGIDEFYGVVAPFALVRRPRPLPSGSLHLHCTDGDGEWLVVPVDGGLVLTHEHAKGTVAWRGSAVALLLGAWGRPNTGLEALGDPTVSAEWSRLAG